MLTPEIILIFSKKGVSTMVASGCAISPPIISLCIRAGWSIDGMKERYLKYESARDKYVGRIVYGLNLLSTNFTVSLLYFNFEHITDTIQVIEMKRKIENWFKKIN